MSIDVEQLAMDYAPIVYHASDEPNLPANMEWFLDRTSLWFYDRNCNPPLKQRLIERPSQQDLVRQSYGPSRDSVDIVYSGGTRSATKWRTFFLDDVDESDRKGCVDPSSWTTYFHVHPNVDGGITIQYWRFHAYNSGLRIDLRDISRRLPIIKIGFHGGDWEGIHVVLNAQHEPVIVRLLGHTGIQRIDWNSNLLQKENTHPVVYSEKKGHATFASASQAGFQPRSAMQHKTWEVGGLVNIGEKTVPLNGQVFVRYSGLWGTPSALPKFVPFIDTSTIQR